MRGDARRDLGCATRDASPGADGVAQPMVAQPMPVAQPMVAQPVASHSQ